MSPEPSPTSADTAAAPDSGQVDVEFAVPDGLLSLAVELDDDTAAAAHAAFVDSRLAPTAPVEIRRQMLAQLAATPAGPRRRSGPLPGPRLGLRVLPR